MCMTHSIHGIVYLIVIIHIDMFNDFIYGLIYLRISKKSLLNTRCFGYKYRTLI